MTTRRRFGPGAAGDVADAVDESGRNSERDDTPCAGENLGLLALPGAFPDGERPDFKCSAVKLSQASWLGQRNKSL